MSSIKYIILFSLYQGSVEVLTSDGHLLFQIDPVHKGERLKAAGVCADKDHIFISTHSHSPGYGSVLQYTKEGRLEY